MDTYDIQHAAYLRGSAAYWDGKLRTDNDGTDDAERQAWFSGFDRAKDLDDEDDF